MSSTSLYRQHAADQQRAAEAATLQNVRERCERASNAWTALADRSERSETERERTASEKLLVRERIAAVTDVDIA